MGDLGSVNFDDVAAALRTALKDCTPIEPPSKTWPSLDAEGAWEVSKINAEHAVKNGDRLVGYKLGNIAKVMQTAFGLDHPDYGFMLGSTLAYEGTSLPLKQYIKPYAELEVAFILKSKLRGPNITVADVISAVDYAVPAIEIIDSRVKNWAIDLPDTLADNGSTGTVILGGTPRQLHQLNLANTRGTLYLNNREVIAGNTRNVLGNPVAAVAWLINRLAPYDIEFLPGQIILPGSCLQAIPITEAGHWSGTFEGFGSIEFDVI